MAVGVHARRGLVLSTSIHSIISTVRKPPLPRAQSMLLWVHVASKESSGLKH